MNRILILFAHPALEKSRVQSRLIRAVDKLENVFLNDLYERYPDFMIDIDYEQELLRSNDIILIQHPFYWYSCPAIIKEWVDLVLEHGFAYGSDGTTLHGKMMANIISTGGSQQTYCAKGHNQFTIAEFLRPFEQTAKLCGLTYLPPFVVHGTHNMTPTRIDEHAKQYRALLSRLVSEVPAKDAIAPGGYLNDWAGQQA